MLQDIILHYPTAVITDGEICLMPSASVIKCDSPPHSIVKVLKAVTQVCG